MTDDKAALRGRYECVVCGEPWPKDVESCPRVSNCSGYRWFNTRALALGLSAAPAAGAEQQPEKGR